MLSALACQKSGDLAGAEALYRQALAIEPDEPDCLHMLGVVQFQNDRPRAALDLILRAAVLTGWQNTAVCHNLGLALGAVLSDGGVQKTIRKQIAYQIWRRRREQDVRDVAPLVSVVVPSYNHASFIQECLESVYRQTWPHIEIIVIDDGSSDESVTLIRHCLDACPFPHRFVARENRGAPATINEGIALASGDYVNILNSDDRFATERITRMVVSVAGIGADWGFAGVNVIDATGQRAARPPGSMAEKLAGIAASTGSAQTVGFALLRANAVISTGNLFFGKQFFNRIGGMSDLRYNHDWEFVLRATLMSEPVYVPEPLYHYRVHGSNTILESSPAAKREADGMLGAHIRQVLDSKSQSNPFAPTQFNWGGYPLAYVLRHGLGVVFPLEQLREMVKLATSESGQHADSAASALLDQLPGLMAARPLLESLESGGGLSATFDQYQRYGMAARAIDQLRQKDQVFSILEVGANTHKLLGKLLPLDRITYLDLEIPAGMESEQDVMIGDATNLALSDGCFDIVVALDVFEHIEPGRRALFLHHVIRVARCMTLIAAPFDSAPVRRAEQEALAYWNSLFAHSYRWLTEHAGNGLPDFTQTTTLLGDMGVGYRGFGHGKLDLWCELLKAHFAAEACADLREPVAAMDRYYRDHLFEHDTDPAGTYRQFLFCSRTPAVLAQLQSLCARMTAAGLTHDPTAFFDVLAAMQYIARSRTASRNI